MTVHPVISATVVGAVVPLGSTAKCTVPASLRTTEKWNESASMESAYGYPEAYVGGLSSPITRSSSVVKVWRLPLESLATRKTLSASLSSYPVKVTDAAVSAVTAMVPFLCTV